MIKKILKILAGIGSVLSAIFFVLFKQAKEERKVIEEKYNDMSDNLNALDKAEKAASEVRKENEKKLEDIKSGNNLNSFNACNDLLSK